MPNATQVIPLCEQPHTYNSGRMCSAHQSHTRNVGKRHEVTGASRVIPQPTTNPADTCLTSRIERDGVC